jgi:hypothetical protein
VTDSPIWGIWTSTTAVSDTDLECMRLASGRGASFRRRRARCRPRRTTHPAAAPSPAALRLAIDPSEGCDRLSGIGSKRPRHQVRERGSRRSASLASRTARPRSRFRTTISSRSLGWPTRHSWWASRKTGPSSGAPSVSPPEPAPPLPGAVAPDRASLRCAATRGPVGAPTYTGCRANSPGSSPRSSSGIRIR